jgi:membrane protease YdiL (CAAX protease family)
MDPEIEPPLPEVAPEQAAAEPAELLPSSPFSANSQGEDEYRGLRWIFIGDQGLRAGWSVMMFTTILPLFAFAILTVFGKLHLLSRQGGFTARSALFGELVWVLALLGAAAIVALIERRRVVDFNLAGPNRALRFFSGLVAGFAALSALIGGLAWGGWLRFGPIALSGPAIFKYGALWACAFLLVGCFEEGVFRGYLQFTLTRGINFWWALGIVGALCLRLALSAKGQGVWGVYIIALLGLLPCSWLHRTRGPRASFWQAAWVTSTTFGFIHTGNNGENWIGIFAAAAIGFIFCVSVWVTGSAWWAIGCHAAWDWGETYFYGAADSGNVARGHYLTTSPAGNPLWSGGSDGPEGSLLVLGIILLLLAALLVIYGRKKAAAGALPVEAEVAS